MDGNRWPAIPPHFEVQHPNPVQEFLSPGRWKGQVTGEAGAWLWNGHVLALINILTPTIRAANTMRASETHKSRMFQNLLYLLYYCTCHVFFLVFGLFLEVRRRCHHGSRQHRWQRCGHHRLSGFNVCECALGDEPVVYIDLHIHTIVSLWQKFTLLWEYVITISNV